MMHVITLNVEIANAVLFNIILFGVTLLYPPL
jgi:hypothetical protein